ncbi:helix-turn-helix domain-containing protein [Halomarina litorea]|uniref:helix-turn-helix domain-containing protein n=1 Tax=Halomarina litorea TaxID=2961595 RepID=UPI0020C2CD97|nr:helix-turn-helix domain-containing protein [Halomarina sp. BCD28]
MSVAVELAVPGDSFELGEVLTAMEGVSIEIERVVPVRERIIPYVWALGDERDVEAAFVSLPSVESVRRIAEIDQWGLYEVRWHYPINGLVASLAEADAAVVSFVSRNDEWYLDLRFPSREDVTAFYEQCQSNDIPVAISRISDSPGPTAQSNLTDKQYDALLAAYESGYFDIPRRITLTDLAEDMDISTQALSQRLRRGNKALVEESLLDRGAPPTEFGVE